MHALIEFIAGVVALLAAAALTQFGVNVNSADPEPEVRRVMDCEESAPKARVASPPPQDC